MNKNQALVDFLRANFSNEELEYLANDEISSRLLQIINTMYEKFYSLEEWKILRICELSGIQVKFTLYDNNTKKEKYYYCQYPHCTGLPPWEIATFQKSV